MLGAPLLITTEVTGYTFMPAPMSLGMTVMIAESARSTSRNCRVTLTSPLHTSLRQSIAALYQGFQRGYLILLALMDRAPRVGMYQQTQGCSHKDTHCRNLQLA